jgi:hypothetical protein
MDAWRMLRSTGSQIYVGHGYTGGDLLATDFQFRTSTWFADALKDDT